MLRRLKLPEQFKDMDKIEALLQKLKAATQEEQEKAVLQIVLRHSHRLLDFCIEQMMHGIDGGGKSLGEYASAKYAEFKKHLNPLGVVDLHLTGDFQDDMYVEATENFPVYISSRNWKTIKLVQNFGEKIFELTKENKERFVEEIKEEIIQYYAILFQL